MQLVMQGAMGVTGRSYTTLLVLAQHADEESGVCWPGMRAIDFLARQSRRTTIRAINWLAAAGWIQIEQRVGRNGTNRYRLDFARMRAESIRYVKPPRQTPPQEEPEALPQPVQKPVEKLWKCCGREVEKASETLHRSANGSTRIIREKLEKYRVRQSKPETATAGGVSPATPEPNPRASKLLAFLGWLNRSAAQGERSRAHVWGLSPPPANGSPGFPCPETSHSIPSAPRVPQEPL